jgi:hypothetical protein
MSRGTQSADKTRGVRSDGEQVRDHPGVVVRVKRYTLGGCLEGSRKSVTCVSMKRGVGICPRTNPRSGPRAQG